MPQTPDPQPSGAVQENKGCQIVVAIGAVLAIGIALSQCDAKKTAPIDAKAPFGAPTLSAQVEAVKPPLKIEPLAPAQVLRGIRHLAIAYAAEGLPGAMIYSQSCYDALARAFTWAQLDRCGAFDLLAVRAAENAGDDSLSNELAYFEPETAAARYLALATKAGETPENADLRLAMLQKRIAKAKPPSAVALDQSGDDGDGEGADDPAAVAEPTPGAAQDKLDADWLDRMTGKPGNAA